MATFARVCIATLRLMEPDVPLNDLDDMASVPPQVAPMSTELLATGFVTTVIKRSMYPVLPAAIEMVFDALDDKLGYIA